MRRPRNIDEVREDFLAFFRGKGHEVVPSSPLVPHGDASLLFVNAGMNQFKDVFLDTGSGNYVRAADTQKCLRVSGKHNDLEEVGYDTYHHTFFEMLGNWSFGDYFKEEAIAWAWELLTERWGLDPGRLYATVHAGDESLDLGADNEAEEVWKRQPGLLEHHVLSFGSKDNFWMMGNTGPCGPCSEIHIDLRPDEERRRIPGEQLVNADSPDVIELWNLVFIQFNAVGDGIIEPLAARHVDTGMGLERLAAVLQGKSSTYDTDAFSPLFRKIAALSPLDYVHDYDDIRDPNLAPKVRIAKRVVADHVRAIAFAIADGVVPGNMGRGYVIRRLLRRAIRYGYQFLGFREPFLHRLMRTVVLQMGSHYAELVTHKRRIEQTVQAEERSFLRTLGKGMKLFERVAPYVRELAQETNGQRHETLERIGGDARMIDLLEKAYGSRVHRSSLLSRFAGVAAEKTVPGEIAFLLHDTYGFPVDLTHLMAREEGLDVDLARYSELMAEQKNRARQDHALGVRIGPEDAALLKMLETEPSDDTVWQRVTEGEDSAFVGYESTRTRGAIIRLLRLKRPYIVVLDHTPFFGESGGQLGDRGVLRVADEEIRVLDTQAAAGRILHVTETLPVAWDAPVEAIVDAPRRARLAKHHTATHLMHAALREVLGPGIAQKGSLVAPDHLRFDFNHHERVSQADLLRVQERVNEVVQRNVAADILTDVPYSEAIAMGATALFGEKYGDKVRVVTFGPAFSVELCGGTHVDASGELGLFLFRSEGSVAAGVRRVEAIAGLDALAVVQREFAELARVRGHFHGLRSASDELVADLVSENRKLARAMEALRRERLEASLEPLIAAAGLAAGARLVSGRLPDTDMETLRTLGASLRVRMGDNAVGLLGTVDPSGGKAYLVAAVSDDLVRKGLKAGKLVGDLARRMGGGGGGRAELATAGGKDPEGLDAVLDAAGDVLAQMLAG